MRFSGIVRIDGSFSEVVDRLMEHLYSLKDKPMLIALACGHLFVHAYSPLGLFVRRHPMRRVKRKARLTP